MNKSTIYIGVGLLAVGGLAYWYFTKPAQVATPESTDLPSDDVAMPPSTPEGGKKAMPVSREPKSKKETRRDCRAEAKSRGLKGKAKRQFRRECKKSGGVDDGADFAFNGFQDPDFY